MQPCVVVPWPSVPAEIVRAAGCRLVISRGASSPTPAADAYLEPRIFPNRLHHLIDDALTGGLATAARIIIPRTSDADYKCFLYLRELVRKGMAGTAPPVVLFDLLQSGGSDVREYDVQRTQALLEELAPVSGRMPSADDLRREISRTNAARAAARRLLALRRIIPRVTGAVAFPLLAAFWEMEPDAYVGMAGDAADRMAAGPLLEGPRVLLSGAPVDGTALHQAIESHGAIVVAEVGPWGSGAAGDDVRIDGDPIAALADKYRADAIGARTPVNALRRATERMLDGVDAVVVSLPPDDAVFGWDYPALRDLLQARGVPHVCLRGDPYDGPSEPEDAAIGAMIAAAARRAGAKRHG